LTQQLEHEHNLDTEIDITSVNEEEMSDDEADISLPPIDPRKPLGQISNSSFDSLEHHSDTSIALNVNNDVQLRSLSPDMIFLNDFPMSYVRQQLSMSFCPIFHSKSVRHLYMHLTPKNFIQKVYSNDYYVRSRDPPASPCPMEGATQANTEVSSSSDHIAEVSLDKDAPVKADSRNTNAH
jgi:hypothetical protein